MADMRLYDRILSNNEINLLFKSRGTDLITTGMRLWLPLRDYPKSHSFSGSEIFRDIIGGLSFAIVNANPISFPFPLRTNKRRREHDVLYN